MNVELLEYALAILMDVRGRAAVCDEPRCHHDDCEINGAELTEQVCRRITQLQRFIAQHK